MFTVQDFTSNASLREQILNLYAVLIAAWKIEKTNVPQQHESFLNWCPCLQADIVFWCLLKLLQMTVADAIKVSLDLAKKSTLLREML